MPPRSRLDAAIRNRGLAIQQTPLATVLSWSSHHQNRFIDYVDEALRSGNFHGPTVNALVERFTASNLAELELYREHAPEETTILVGALY